MIRIKSNTLKPSRRYECSLMISPEAIIRMNTSIMNKNEITTTMISAVTCEKVSLILLSSCTVIANEYRYIR